MRKFLSFIITMCVLFGSVNSCYASNIKWYEYNTVVAHALGSVDGRKETNSKEAFLESYDKGIRVMEVDFELTSDGTLVARHDFDQDSYYTLEQKVLNGSTQMDITRYLKEKICFKYTPLTAEDILLLMKEYEDVFIITDSKRTDEQNIRLQFQNLVDSAQKLNCTDVLDRFIIQIYNDEMYDTIKSIYEFENWIYTLYQVKNPDFNKIGQFCQSNNIEVVTINESILTSEISQILKSYGLRIYTHTINRLLDAQKLRSLGAYGIYSDILSPDDMSLVGMGVKTSSYTPILYNGKKENIKIFNQPNKRLISLNDLCKYLNRLGIKIKVDINEEEIKINLNEKSDEISSKAVGDFHRMKKYDSMTYINGDKVDLNTYKDQDIVFVDIEEFINLIGYSFRYSEEFKRFEILEMEESTNISEKVSSTNE